MWFLGYCLHGGSVRTTPYKAFAGNPTFSLLIFKPQADFMISNRSMFANAFIADFHSNFQLYIVTITISVMITIIL